MQGKTESYRYQFKNKVSASCSADQVTTRLSAANPIAE
jgi:hypothetical protein